jgi:hypothetical protein
MAHHTTSNHLNFESFNADAYIPGIPQKSLSCSEEFRELMALPTFGARNLKHLAKATSSGTVILCDCSVCAKFPQPLREPLILGLCFRTPGEP